MPIIYFASGTLSSVLKIDYSIKINQHKFWQEILRTWNGFSI